MAEHLIDRVLEPVASHVRDWLKARAQRAELHGLPDAERASLLREIGITEAGIEKLSSHPGPEVFLPKRLDEVGLDAHALEASHPATFRDMQRVCSSCPDWKKCRADIDRADAVERLAHYCPNTYTIDCLRAEDDPSHAPTVTS